MIRKIIGRTFEVKSKKKSSHRQIAMKVTLATPKFSGMSSSLLDPEYGF